MNSPLIIFTIITLTIIVLFGYFLRGAIFSITTVAASHAKQFALAYVKGGALITIAMMTSFKETFHPLTIEQAARLAWWDWAILYMSPMAAGLAVLVAFLDRSIQSARENGKPETTGQTAPPFSP